LHEIKSVININLRESRKRYYNSLGALSHDRIIISPINIPVFFNRYLLAEP